eukprot:3144447-Amphidinium_carterae.1
MSSSDRCQSVESRAMRSSCRCSTLAARSGQGRVELLGVTLTSTSIMKFNSHFQLSMEDFKPLNGSCVSLDLRGLGHEVSRYANPEIIGT